MYNIIYLPHFKKQVKKLSKQQRGLKNDLAKELDSFLKFQHSGLGKNLYKIRFTTRDLNRGKSRSFRVIVLCFEIEKRLVPVTIYFKGNKKSLKKQELKEHAEVIKNELKSLK